jgi:hypothetical protein
MLLMVAIFLSGHGLLKNILCCLSVQMQRFGSIVYIYFNLNLKVAASDATIW